MLGFLGRKLGFWKQLKQDSSAASGVTEAKKGEAAQLSDSLDKNLQSLQARFHHSSDLKISTFLFGKSQRFRGATVFIDGLIDNNTLTSAVSWPLLRWEEEGAPPELEDMSEVLKHEALYTADVMSTRSLEDVAAGCLAGDITVIVDGCSTALLVSAKGWEKRAISEPSSETVVRGPREGFTENLRTNTSLIRRKIRSSDLCVENMIAGEKTQTRMCLMYLKGVANPDVVETVRYRIAGLEIDSVLESGYIEQYIEDVPFSVFSTVGYSEKPDVVAARMLEGRVAIAIDGTPFVLTAPMLFIESFQIAEDYYVRWIYASLIRMLRYVTYVISVCAPALYIALTVFHQGMIPSNILFTLSNAHEGTPLPTFLEMLVMLFGFELIREAGIRLPRPVGQAISIVGALIMGEAVVSAGMVGAPTVIVIAITAVASFLVPDQNNSGTILRVLVTFAASILGFYGIIMGVLAILIHLASLESFGVPYFDGFLNHGQDSLIRMPLWSMLRRPDGIARGDMTRRRFFVPPLRPHASKNTNGRE